MGVLAQKIILINVCSQKYLGTTGLTCPPKKGLGKGNIKLLSLSYY